jgi:NAD(P)H dehydrogenase (quinone)
MNVLAVFCHPVRASFCGALLDGLVEGLGEAGHQVKVADLYRERFQPAFVPEDYAQFDAAPMPADVQAEQARVEWSQALAFVFPVWWWTMPAMLKGWIDRVFSYGWAWQDPSYPNSLLGQRKALVLCTAGGDDRQFQKYGYREAMRVQLDVGTWGYCGLKDATTRIFYGVDRTLPGTDYARYIEDARAMGRGLGREAA